MCFTHSFFHFAILRKSLQTTSASPCRIYGYLLRQFYLLYDTDSRQFYLYMILTLAYSISSNYVSFHLQPQNSILS
ncbi:Uncharacterised protein [Streptococcus pneumoniae]|nr:Uncharacterised protein [Streptococcus pneumoniae]